MPTDPNQDLQHELSERREIERVTAEERVERGEHPWEEEAGVMSVVDAVRDLRFPASREEISECAGDRIVHTSKRGEFPLREVLRKVPEVAFVSIREFQTAVQRHWAGIRYLEVPQEQRPGGGASG